jgi:hypothetical protein
MTVYGTHYAARFDNSNRCPSAGYAMKRISAALALFFVTLVACSTMAPGSGNDQNQRTAVQVDNRGFSDMNVYAARSAQRVRLGMAPGHSTTLFTVPPGLVSGLTPLRFIADPIGGTRPSVSEEITVAPGDTVVMTIPPN